MTHLAASPLAARGSMLVQDATLQTHSFESALLGRSMRATPAALSKRVLYLPAHNHFVTTHLPIYEYATEYTAAVGDRPIGSTRFKTGLGLMPKPTGDGRSNSDVQYLVDIDATASAGKRAGTVTRRALSRAGEVEVNLSLPQGALEPVELKLPSQDAPLPMTVSFPLPPIVMRAGSSRNPWFTFTLPALFDDYRVFQWQLHPLAHGLLRYDLVEVPESAVSTGQESYDGSTMLPSAVNGEGIVKAIYHNVGLGFSLVQMYSEGVLLLTEGLEPELEALIVASLMGLLWQARRMETGKAVAVEVARRMSRGEPAPKKSDVEHIEDRKVGILGKVFKRRKASVS